MFMLSLNNGKHLQIKTNKIFKNNKNDKKKIIAFHCHQYLYQCNFLMVGFFLKRAQSTVNIHKALLLLWSVHI